MAHKNLLRNQAFARLLRRATDVDFLSTSTKWIMVTVGLHIAAGCNHPQREAAEPSATAVTVVELQQRNPAGEFRMMGAAQAWKEEDIAFEVGGRLRFVVEPGTTAQGPEAFPGQERGPTLLARLDDRRYKQKVAANQARKEVAELEQEAAQAELDGVLAADLRVAQSEFERAERELTRQNNLLADKATSRTLRDQALAAFEVAKARIDQVQANFNAKKSQIRSYDAQIRELEVAVEQAKLDVADCQLYAPFRGQVSQVHAIPGGLLQPGEQVVKLVMMDPLRIEVAVSAEMDRRVSFGDHLRVRIPELGIERWGTVMNSDTEADAATRTFHLSVIVRNEKIEIPDCPDLTHPRIHEFRILRPLEAGREGPLYIEEKSLYRDDRGAYTWRIVGGTRTDFSREVDTVRKLERVDLVLGEGRIALPGEFAFLELVDSGPLTTDDVLACGVPEDFKSGEQVLLVRRRWLLRPGDLVELEFPHPEASEGFYVPLQSIVAQGDQHFLFMVTGTSPPTVKRVQVRLGGRLGQLFRVEPGSEDDSWEEGARVVSAGSHYVHDGDVVRVIETEEVEP